jgi:hypothetical protein
VDIKKHWVNGSAEAIATMNARITRRRLMTGAAGFGAGVLILPGINARPYHRDR